MSKNKLTNKTEGYSIATYGVEGDFLFTAPPNRLSIGIDPGTTNMGIATLDTVLDKCYIYQISMPRKKMPDRILQLQYILSKCIHNFYHANNMYASIEGASYGGYRQVELAEARAICADWLLSRLLNYKLISIVPPKKIRKDVFGNGETLAQEVFITDEKIPDALASLSCAYYASSTGR